MASELLFRTMEQNKIETDKKTLTIFTPTYNRAYTLHLGYEALSRQTCKDFIWLIVDDGSTDDTLEWVEKWIAERKIDMLDLVLFVLPVDAFTSTNVLHTIRLIG